MKRRTFLKGVLAITVFPSLSVTKVTPVVYGAKLYMGDKLIGDVFPIQTTKTTGRRFFTCECPIIDTTTSKNKVWRTFSITHTDECDSRWSRWKSLGVE